VRRLIVPVLVSGLLLFFVLLVLSVQAQTAAPPAIMAITPDTGPADQQTTVTITGQGFTTTSEAYLDNTSLLDVTFVDSTTLQAVVPFGLSTGVYTLTVTNPQTGALTNAFTVTAGTLGWASGGPYGGETRAIAINPAFTDTVYVAAQLAGLFRTIDGGENWELVFQSPLQPRPDVLVWPVNPEVVFFTAQDGLYRSDQGGDPGSWSWVSFPTETPHIQPNALAIAPSDPYTMYCAIGNTMFHSSDGGVTWQERSTGLPGEPTHLAVDPNNAAVVYAAFGDEGTLFKTTNAGQLWTQLPFSIPMSVSGTGGIQAIAADLYRDNNLWLGSSNHGFYRSIDGGQTFTEVTSLYTVSHQSWFPVITFDPNQDRIYVGTIGPNDAIHYSDDNGDTWYGLGMNNRGGYDIAVAPGDSNTIYTTWAGVHKSTDGGQNWAYLSRGIAAVQPWRIVVSPHDPQRVMVVAGNDGAFGTHNSGNEWVKYVTGHPWEADNYRSAVFDPISTTVAYLGGGNTVYKTTDDGQSWQPTGAMVLPGPPGKYSGAQSQFLTFHPQTHTMLYAGVAFQSSLDPRIIDGALYYSEDGGDSWTHIAATGPISAVNRVVFAPGHPEVIYLGTGVPDGGELGNGIWRSQDGGQTWEHPDSQLSGYMVRALVVHPGDPDTLLAGVWSGSNDGEGIYRSTDGGDSWQVTDGLQSHEELKVLDIAYDPFNAQIVYAATHGGMRISYDGGRSWQSYHGSMGQLAATALTLSQDGERTRFYVGTVGGTIVGETALLPTAQTQSALVMEAGVYMGQAQWHFVHLPLVLKASQ